MFDRAFRRPADPRCPMSSTVPLVGLLKPMTMRMSVDFPAPFSPMRP